MKIVEASYEGAVTEIAEALRAGGVVVVPTDTVYGIAANIDHPEAISRIFDLKKRKRLKALPVLVSKIDDARRFAIFSEDALEEVRDGWPGALTVVLHRSEAAREIDLGGDGISIGLRVPDHPFLLAVIEESGPIATTSANPSGALEASTIDGPLHAFGEGVDVYVDGGRLAGNPSRVVSFLGERRVIRE